MAKGAGMLAPSLATMLCVLTTDAVAEPPRSSRRCAAPPRGRSTGSTSTAAARPTTPCCCWPRAPAKSRPAKPISTMRCCGSATTCARSCKPTPKASPNASPSRVTGALHRGRRRHRGPGDRAGQPGQDRAVRLRPELGPRAGRGRHGAGATRPRPDHRVVQRFSGLHRRRRRAGCTRRGPVGHRHRGDRRPGGRHRARGRSGPPTCRTPTSKRTRPTRHDHRTPTSRRRCSPRRCRG